MLRFIFNSVDRVSSAYKLDCVTDLPTNSRELKLPTVGREREASDSDSSAVPVQHITGIGKMSL